MSPHIPNIILLFLTKGRICCNYKRQPKKESVALPNYVPEKQQHWLTNGRRLTKFPSRQSSFVRRKLTKKLATSPPLSTHFGVSIQICRAGTRIQNNLQKMTMAGIAMAGKAPG
jgi:hypothetical protein